MPPPTFTFSLTPVVVIVTFLCNGRFAQRGCAPMEGATLTTSNLRGGSVGASPTSAVKERGPVRAEGDSIALSVIIPTRNEEASVRPLIARIDAVLEGIPSEVIFVDDSDDRTPGIIDDLVDAHR